KTREQPACFGNLVMNRVVMIRPDGAAWSCGRHFVHAKHSDHFFNEIDLALEIHAEGRDLEDRCPALAVRMSCCQPGNGNKFEAELLEEGNLSFNGHFNPEQRIRLRLPQRNLA